MIEIIILIFFVAGYFLGRFVGHDKGYQAGKAVYENATYCRVVDGHLVTGMTLKQLRLRALFNGGVFTDTCTLAVSGDVRRDEKITIGFLNEKL